MAKKYSEVKMIEEDQIAKNLDEDALLVYKEALRIKAKLKRPGSRLKDEEIKSLLDFYEDKRMNVAKMNFTLETKQKNRLIASIYKTNNPMYALKTSLHIETIPPKKLEELIEKDEDTRHEYAGAMLNGAVRTKRHESPLDLILDQDDFANLINGEITDEAVDKVASLLLMSRYEDMLDEFLTRFADKIYGDSKSRFKVAQDKLGIKGESMDDLSNSDKVKVTEAVLEIDKAYNEFISRVKHKLQEYTDDAKAVAANDFVEDNAKVGVNDFEQELERNQPLKKALEDNVSKKLNESFKDLFEKSNAVLADIKRRHPKDYEAYLNKLRKTKIYKAEYKKYSQMFAQKRDEIRSQEVSEMKKSVDASSKREAVKSSQAKSNAPTNTKTEDEEATM